MNPNEQKLLKTETPKITPQQLLESETPNPMQSSVGPETASSSSVVPKGYILLVIANIVTIIIPQLLIYTSPPWVDISIAWVIFVMAGNFVAIINIVVLSVRLKKHYNQHILLKIIEIIIILLSVAYITMPLWAGLAYFVGGEHNSKNTQSQSFNLNEPD